MSGVEIGDRVRVSFEGVLTDMGDTYAYVRSEWYEYHVPGGSVEKVEPTVKRFGVGVTARLKANGYVYTRIGEDRVYHHPSLAHRHGVILYPSPEWFGEFNSDNAERIEVGG